MFSTAAPVVTGSTLGTIASAAQPAAIAIPIALKMANLGNWHASENYMASYQNGMTDGIKKIINDLNAKQQAGAATLDDLQVAHSSIANILNNFQQFVQTTGGKAAQQGWNTMTGWVAPLLENLGGLIKSKGGNVSVTYPAGTSVPGGTITWGNGNPTVNPANSGTPGAGGIPNQSLISQLLKIGVPIGSQIIGAILSNRMSDQEKAALAQLAESSKASEAAGQQLLAAAASPLATASGFWQSLLTTGNMPGAGAPTALLGPEIARTGERYDQTLQALRETAPRSGATEIRAAELPFEKARATTTLYQNLLGQREGERYAAVNNIASMGSNLANLGLYGLTGGRSGSVSLLDYQQGRRDRASNTGLTIGNTLARVLFGNDKSGGGGGFGG